MDNRQLVQAACKGSIIRALAVGGIFTSGLFIVAVLRGNTPYSLYSSFMAKMVIPLVPDWGL